MEAPTGGAAAGRRRGGKVCTIEDLVEFVERGDRRVEVNGRA